jgi:hypothetical protein
MWWGTCENRGETHPGARKYRTTREDLEACRPQACHRPVMEGCQETKNIIGRPASGIAQRASQLRLKGNLCSGRPLVSDFAPDSL